MPPFINTKCTNCSKPNRFDLAELSKENGTLMKKIMFREDEKTDREFEVTCQHCGRKFKFTLRGEDNGKA